jgi:prolipoprotein diacylglyceryl transferase
VSAVIMSQLPADIPSPSSGTLTIGPLSLNAYGLMIALGVIAAVWLFGRRLEQKGIGTRDDANAIAIWAVLAGVIGARLYHVITDWSRFEGNYGDIVKIWEGGLGIPGGILLGTLVGVYVIRRRGLPLGPAVNAAAPALPLAQAIGRWGNYFNQELFGSPTDLPWALEVDDQTALDAGYPPGTTFHPTFLYESLCNFALCGLLLWIDKRFNPAGGRLFAMYVLGYGVIRFWVEGLRIDPADELGGLRWNQWVALACVVGGGLYLIATRDKPKEVLVPAGAGAAIAAAEEDELESELVEGELVDDDAPAEQRHDDDDADDDGDDDGDIEDADIVEDTPTTADDASVWAEQGSNASSDDDDKS